MSEKWNYMDLIKTHRILVNEEGRFKFYTAYMDSRKPNAWLESPYVPLKEALLLFGWVHSWDPNYEAELLKFLTEYERIFPLMKSFESRTIIDMEFKKQARAAIAQVFDSLAKCCRTKRFESTDTSKAMHGMIPELFVMWDDKIKKGILGIKGTGSGREYDGACYANEFLPLMQSMAKQFLDSFVQKHGGDYGNACKAISKMTDGYTLAKLIDEFNYLRFTKGWVLEDIRRKDVEV
jgi:hypothetical protein